MGDRHNSHQAGYGPAWQDSLNEFASRRKTQWGNKMKDAPQYWYCAARVQSKATQKQQSCDGWSMRDRVVNGWRAHFYLLHMFIKLGLAQQVPKLRVMQTSLQSNIIAMDDSFGITVSTVQWIARPCDSELLDLCPSLVTNLACHRMSRTSLACWAEARLKIARMTLTIKLDGNWSSFQLANSAPPLSVTDSALAPSPRMMTCLILDRNMFSNL